MSRIAIIGGGHVGSVYAAGLARLGHDVSIVEVNQKRVRAFRKGNVWFYEPRLSAMFAAGVKAGRIRATASYKEGLRESQFVFLCVPTPIAPDGNLDDSYVTSALSSIVAALGDGAPPILVNKSTVPVGTSQRAAELLSDKGIQMVSNPEFLAQGRAVEDFFHPARIVIGCVSREAGAQVARLFRRIRAPIIVTDPVTAELIKLASNAFLATKISFANVLSAIGTPLGADVGTLVRGVGLDPRIGQAHLQPGLGYGGSCLPKDLAALEHLARQVGAPYDLFSGASAINRYQRTRVIDHLKDKLGRLDGMRVTVLGAAFKADTDDIRESPGIDLARDLLTFHAEVTVWDPHVPSTAIAAAIPTARTVRGLTTALRGADAAVIATAWPELQKLDSRLLRRTMRRPLIIDGRGVLDSAARGNDIECVEMGA